MIDLIEKFYTADLSLQEEEALDALLGSSVEDANRFADKAAEAYARFGLPELGPDSGSGLKTGARWIYGLALLSLAFLAWFGWHHYGPGSKQNSTSSALTTVPPSMPASGSQGSTPSQGWENNGVQAGPHMSPITPTQGNKPGERTHSLLKIQVATTQAGSVTVRVLDTGGLPVKTLFSGMLSPGTHDFSWDGRLDNGRKAPPGTYRIETRSGSAVQTREFIIENKAKNRE